MVNSKYEVSGDHSSVNSSRKEKVPLSVKVLVLIVKLVSVSTAYESGALARLNVGSTKVIQAGRVEVFVAESIKRTLNLQSLFRTPLKLIVRAGSPIL